MPDCLTMILVDSDWAIEYYPKDEKPVKLWKDDNVYDCYRTLDEAMGEILNASDNL